MGYGVGDIRAKLGAFSSKTSLLRRILLTEEVDRELTEEAFNMIVDNLVKSFSLLRWKWLGGPGESSINY